MRRDRNSLVSRDKHFDIVLIGAGPAAVAALYALSDGHRIAVVTGAMPSMEKLGGLHPKIQAISIASAEVAGVAERVSAASRRSRPLFSTAAVGGLARYWGQQFVRWDVSDPWSQDVFADFADYERACAHIEGLFSIDGGEAAGVDLASDGYGTARPRLIVGSATHPHAGLRAMHLAFEAVAEAAGAHRISARAHSIVRTGVDWTVVLDDGARLTAPQILLAAGVLGDGQLLLRSFPDLSGVRFDDHVPWMLYTMGPKRSFPDVKPEQRAFNALTARHATHTVCDMFASFYDMGRADLNLLLASTAGRAFPTLRNWPAPPGAGLVTPVQVWTPDTYGEVELVVGKTETAFRSRRLNDGAADRSLEDFQGHLRRRGCRVLHRTQTEAGFGFHYHRLRLGTSDGAWSGVADLLKDRTNGVVAAIDGAALEQIGCQPHTLTMMARAWVQVSRMMQ